VLAREAVDRGRLDAALAAIDAASPPVKGRILAACGACAAGSASRGEAVRAVAAALGQPLPLQGCPARAARPAVEAT
jgi:hypothetical protein